MSTMLSHRPITLPARSQPSIADMKPAIVTLWSAQVALVERVMDNVKDAGQIRAAMGMLHALKREIEKMVAGTDEAWFTGLPEDKRIQNIIENDFSKLLRRCGCEI